MVKKGRFPWIARAVASLAAAIKKLSEPQWPEGEPIMSGGERIGTKLADGKGAVLIGVKFEFAPVCSRCQQAIDAERGDSRAADLHR